MITCEECENEIPTSVDKYTPKEECEVCYSFYLCDKCRRRIRYQLYKSPMKTKYSMKQFLYVYHKERHHTQIDLK